MGQAGSESAGGCAITGSGMRRPWRGPVAAGTELITSGGRSGLRAEAANGVSDDRVFPVPVETAHDGVTQFLRHLADGSQRDNVGDGDGATVAT